MVDLGLIVYEMSVCEGMVLDEGVLVEIVCLGIGDFVFEGEVGEVVVSMLNLDYFLICFVIGDFFVLLFGVCLSG